MYGCAGRSLDAPLECSLARRSLAVLEAFDLEDYTKSLAWGHDGRAQERINLTEPGRCPFNSSRLGKDVAEHVRHERQIGVGRREGRHDLARVRLDAKTVHAWHDQTLAGRDEAHNSDHSEAAVVDLRLERLGLALVRHLLGEAERVPQVQRHRVDRGLDAVLERREVSW